MIKIKICGITNYDDAKLALDLGADALGFNFFSRSPRCLAVTDAQAIVRRLHPQAWFVGIFVNHSKSEIEHIARTVGLDTLQFHGDEAPEFCAGWKEWRVMKAIRVGTQAPTQELIKAYQNVADVLIFDGFKDSTYGGTGEEIAPQSLGALRETEVLRSSFLSGGLTPDNVRAKIESAWPFGVDVASGVEVHPRRKSPELLRKFIEAVRGV